MLPLVTDANWPSEIEDMRAGFAGRLNVYRIMAHHPRLLRSWQDFRNHVVIDTRLGAELSEVVILRSGLNLGSAYEWAHHVHRSRKLGMSDARILAVSGDGQGLDAQDALLIRATDQLFAHKRLLPKTQTALVAALGKEAMLDLMATVAHYSMLGFMLNSFDVDIDADVSAQSPLAPHAPFTPVSDDLP